MAAELNKIHTLEKENIKQQGELNLLKQHVDHIQEGFNKSRETGFKAWEAVNQVKEQLTKEIERINTLSRDLEGAFAKIKRLEADMKERIAEVGEDTSEAKNDFKDWNKYALWALLITLSGTGLLFSFAWIFKTLRGG